MDIFGIGTDIIEVDRVQKAMMRHAGFLHKVYTASEIAYCSQKKQASIHYAARFAAKEAVFKCFSIQTNGVGFFKEIEVCHASSGAPVVVLHGRMRACMQKNRVRKVLLSISGIKSMAAAYAVAIL